jgi:carboxylesterase type B
MGGSLYFGPVLDGTNLPRHPFFPDAAPQSLGIPMILGNVLEETRAFLDPRGPKLRGLAWDNIAWRVAAEVKVDLEPQGVIAAYRAHHPDWSPEQVYYAATTAGRSWPGQVIEADARARRGAKPGSIASPAVRPSTRCAALPIPTTSPMSLARWPKKAANGAAATAAPTRARKPRAMPCRAPS